MTSPVDPATLHLIAAYGSRAGSARVRLHDWVTHLGITAHAHSYASTSDNSLATLRADPSRTLRAELRTRRLPGAVLGETAVLSRTATPFSRGGIEAKALRAAGHGVYDVDDAIMLPQSGLQHRMFPKGEVFRRASSAADVVIAGNDFLADAASSFAADVRVIPSCVEPGDYVAPAPRADSSAPKLVWIGSPSTERYLSAIAPALTSACRELRTQLIVISAGKRPIPGLSPELVERVTWHPQCFAKQISMGDVGIMPLEDTAWERGKCAYKLLQYGASSLPVVGSPIGANKEVLRLMRAPAPSTIDEWRDALVASLRMSEQDRLIAGRRARRAIEKHYSFSAHSATWCEAVGISSIPAAA